MVKEIINKFFNKNTSYLIKYGFISLILVICIIQFAIHSQASSGPSNELLAWGFKRGQDNSQPVLDRNSKKVVEKYNGIAMGNPERKYLYLTFDAGYEAGYTEKILQVLKDNNVPAAFFLAGHYLNSASDMVKKMIENGHIVANHTVNHKNLVNLNEEEIKKEVMDLHNALYEKFGYEMKYFRPPKGEFSERTTEVTNSLGYISVLWSSAYDDWDKNKQGREEYGKKKIMDNLHNGCVILLHSTSKDNAEILDDVIKEAKKMGYEFRSLDKFER